MAKCVLVVALFLSIGLACQAALHKENQLDGISLRKLMSRQLVATEECLLEQKPCRQACRDKDYAGGRCISLGTMDVCICNNPKPRLAPVKPTDVRPECAKCSLPAKQGGCANGCNSDCECQTITEKCKKCFLKHSEGGCKDGCDFDCNCN